MIIKKIVTPLVLLFILGAAVYSLTSCETDARNTTRIPPTPTAHQKSNWKKDAIAALTFNIEQRIDVDESYFKRAMIYFADEQYSAAHNDMNEAIEIRENVGQYYLMRAKIRRELNNLDKAFEDAERAEALQQDNPDLYILLADLLQEKKRFREAQRYLTSSMKMAPHNASAFYVQGMLQANMGDTLTSLKSFDHAIRLNPKLLRGYQQITLLYNQLGDFENALHYNTIALKRYPKNPDLYQEKGDIYFKKNKIDSSLIYYSTAIQLNPEQIRSHFQLGTIYMKYKNYTEAIRAYEKVMKINTSYPEIHYLIGLCFERSGNDEKAKEFYTLETLRRPDDVASIAGLYRIQNREMMRYTLPSEDDEDNLQRTLDSSGVQINRIQPRKPFNLGSDSARRIQIP